VNRKDGKWLRIALWTVTMPIYYFVLFLPLFTWIYATFTIKVPFSSLFTKIAPMAALEMIMTIIVTDIAWAVLPDKFAKPVK